MNIDELKQDFEFYYKYSKQLERIMELQAGYITKLEKAYSNIKVSNIDYGQIRKKSNVRLYQQYQDDINRLEIENQKLRDTIVGLDNQLRSIKERIERYV